MRHRKGCAYAIDFADNSSDTGETRTTAGHDADVLVRVLADLVLAVLLVVEVGHRLAQRYCDERKDRQMDVNTRAFQGGRHAGGA